MRKLKILFNTSQGSFSDAGGGEVQLLATKKELEKRGHSVKILEKENYSVDFWGFDVFHNFNIHRDNSKWVAKAKQAGLPVAISTIYWPSLHSTLFWQPGTGRKAKALAVELVNKMDFLGLSAVGRMLRKADALLPNSNAEAAVLEKHFRVARRKIHVVPNGVERRFKNAKPDLFEKKFGLRDFVLYVGRIEERKNVLGLIRAAKRLGCELVLIGSAKKGSEGYSQKCKAEAGKNVVFLQPVPHESELLASAYAACKVFCLPSWYETPGLAALEAALAGANIVVTSEGCTREYFEDFVSYVNPASVRGIGEKIAIELRKPRSKALSRHVELNFLWENAAIETELAYGGILR